MRVEVEAGVEQRAVAAREHIHRPAQLDQQVAVLGEPRRERGRDVVGEPGDDRDAARQARVSRATSALIPPITWRGSRIGPSMPRSIPAAAQRSGA